uniref:Uncharacterized protein n=1 Tax=Anguilla anguilla TaxID=7936 RepID=A0A0E9XMI8_ANGAN
MLRFSNGIERTCCLWTFFRVSRSALSEGPLKPILSK